MQGVYFATYHVPFTAPTSLYPGLTLYLQQMKKYEPDYVYNELAIQGWESAALFVQGVRAAGRRSHVGQRDQTDQRPHVVHGGWIDGAGQLGRRRSHQPRPALLRGLHHGQRHAVRSRPEQGSERLQLLPFSEHEGEPGLSGPSRHARAVLAGSRMAGHVPFRTRSETSTTPPSWCIMSARPRHVPARGFD